MGYSIRSVRARRYLQEEFDGKLKKERPDCTLALDRIRFGQLEVRSPVPSSVQTSTVLVAVRA